MAFDFSGGINANEILRNLPAPSGGGLPGGGGAAGIPGVQPRRGMRPAPGNSLQDAGTANKGMSATLVEMLPHIMNTLGDSSPAVTQQINRIQAEAEQRVQREQAVTREARKRANLSRFGAAIFSQGEKLDGAHVMQMAEQLGIPPAEAMKYLSNFQSFQAKKRGPEMTFSRQLDGGGVQTVKGFRGDIDRLGGEGFSQGTLSGLPGRQAQYIKTDRGLYDTQEGRMVPDTGKLPPVEKPRPPLSPIGKLRADRDRLPEGDPGRAEFDRAIAKANTLSGGMEIVTDKEGNTTIRTNARRPGGGLERSARTEVQKDLLTATKTLSEVSKMGRLYRPEFQEIGTRLNAKFIAGKEKLGLGIDDVDRNLLADFAEYKAASGKMVTQTLKDLSGAAVTKSEEERFKSYFPVAGSGVFDGDSPTELNRKMKALRDDTRRAVVRLNYINKRGDLTLNDISLDDVDGLIEKRGGEMEAEIIRANPGANDADVLRMVKSQLAEEFGLVN